MRNFLFSIALLIFSVQFLHGQTSSCAEFSETIRATYNFRPALLANEAQRSEKSAAMDRIWDAVKSNPTNLVPCLRTALEDSKADAWFRFDGSNLLVSVDPSRASKELQIRSYAASNLDDVNLKVWVTTLAIRGVEDLDTSVAGEQWLAYPKATYYLPEHGAFKVNKLLGATFIFGSMEEAYATPALLRIATSKNHAGRETAISLLLMQATPEAIRGLKDLDPATLSRSTVAALNEPSVFEPREKPKTSRAEFLKAFNEAVAGNWSDFFNLVRQVPDGEKDVVATLKAEDIPLVRKVRRLVIAHANPHAAEFYDSFTKILMTMIWRPERAK